MKKRQKLSLKKRLEVSYKDRENKINFSVLDFSKLPEDLKFYKPKEGLNKIIILPYLIATENHPLVTKGVLEVGDLDYVLDIWEHRGVGLNKENVICLKRTYGKACPICEIAEQKKLEGDLEAYSRLKPSRRVYYNVIDLNGDNEEILLFEVSHFLFEKELIEEAVAVGDDIDGEPVNFADLEEGKIVKFRASVAKIGTREYLEFKSFSFVDRKPISEDILQKTLSLDKFLILRNYDEIVKMLDGSETREEIPNFEEKNKFEEVSKVEEKKEEIKDKKCPFGHRFGIDTDTFDDCDECEIWDKCSLEKEQ